MAVCLKTSKVQALALALMVEALALMAEALALMVEASALMVEALVLTLRVEALALMVEALALRLWPRLHHWCLAKTVLHVDKSKHSNVAWHDDSPQ